MRMPLNEKIREDVHAAEWKKQSARIHTPLNKKSSARMYMSVSGKTFPGMSTRERRKKRAGVSLPDGQGMSK